MSEPLDFTAKLASKRAAHGERNFLLCGCQQDVGDEPAGFYPVVQHDAAGEFVYALVCMACEESIDLINGRPKP